MRRSHDTRRDARAVRASWWSDLGPWARFSVAGLAIATALAFALAWFIPNWVGDRFLETQARADQSVLTALTETEALVVRGAGDFADLEAFVDRAVLRGDFVRVKLWGPDQTILYSDEPNLIGRRFELDEDFDTMFEPMSHVTDLSAAENELERAEFDAGLLETYVPVRTADGELLAVWEVYHLLDDHDAAVAETRWTVLFTVGAGLGLLAVFLVSVFGGLIASVQRRRREAESRSSELSTLLNIVRSSAQTLDEAEIVAATTRELHASGAFEWVTLSEADHEGESTVLAVEGDPSDVEHASDPCVRVAAATDVAAGTLTVVGCVPADSDAEAAQALLQASVAELGVSTQRAKLYDEVETSRARLRELMKQLVTAQEQERQRIVGDIHDGLGQDLHRVLFGVRGCLTADSGEIEAELHKLEELVSNSSAKLRRLLQELHPSTIDDIGLAASLRSLVDRLRTEYELHVEFRSHEFDEPPGVIRIAVFRIAQEALANVVKHSGTLEARLSVTSDGREIELVVDDRGARMSDDRGEGLGLWLMRERAESLGGSFEITSGSDGTRVRARIPLEEAS
jgi:signal transduction histidine kinase